MQKGWQQTLTFMQSLGQPDDDLRELLEVIQVSRQCQITGPSYEPLNFQQEETCHVGFPKDLDVLL